MVGEKDGILKEFWGDRSRSYVIWNRTKEDPQVVFVVRRILGASQ